MAPSDDRSWRGRLQALIGELGEVHPYRSRIEDLEHPEIGWWVTPAIPIAACDCELCDAARSGWDVHLGATSRSATINAGRIVAEHLRSAA